MQHINLNPWKTTQLCHIHTKIKPLTFSQAVADAGIPGQQGISAVEAQDQCVGQAEDGESVGHPIIAGPWLYTTDPLREQTSFYFTKTPISSS